MEQQTVINSTKSFEGFRKRAENILYGLFPQKFDSGEIHGIHMGRQKETSPGMRGGHRIPATPSTMASVLFFAIVDSMMNPALIANEDARRKTFEKK